MRLFLAVDGGGTRCRAAVADAAGSVLGRAEAGGANIWTDPDGALAHILEAARGALAAAGEAPDLAPLVAVLGLAGANVPEAAERLAARLPFAQAVIESDAMIALRGALGTEDGIAVTLGTGSVFGVQRNGVPRLAGGWGMVLGDHGSGARLGRAVLEAALLAHDGLAPGSPLLGEVVAEAGGPAALVAFAQRAVPSDFARYAPRIVAAAAGGDAGAEAILAGAEAEVAHGIDALCAGEPLPICLLGGLGPIYAARLARRYGARLRPARGSAIDGALELARRLT